MINPPTASGTAAHREPVERYQPPIPHASFLAVLAAVVVWALLLAPAPGARSALAVRATVRPAPHIERVAAAADTGGGPATVDGLIVYWASVYGIPPGYLLALSYCEDPTRDIWAVGPHGEQGVYQFQPHGGIWDSTLYGQRGITPFGVSVSEQVRVAAELIAAGHAREWSCA